jgi:hypothetical protein
VDLGGVGGDAGEAAVGGGTGTQRAVARSLGEEEDVVVFLREGIRLVHPCVGPGRTLDRELLGEPFPGRCVLFLMKQSEGCQIFYFGKIYKF